MRTYLGARKDAQERFIDTYQRIGAQPFKDAYMARAKMPLDRDIESRVSGLNQRYKHHAATAVMERALKDPEVGNVALVSSFGANQWCCCIWSR